jgi:mRNA interferase HigB
MRYSQGMHSITRKRLLEFSKKHSEYSSAIDSWYRIFKHTDFDSFEELRRAFPSADQVGKLTVFNIGGNKVRLIVAMHYNTHRVYIRKVLTHAEYNRQKWKE